MTETHVPATMPLETELAGLREANESLERLLAARTAALAESERRFTELEAQFLQSQKMETVGLLAGGIAHDFNNLLTIINGTAELALQGLAPGDPLSEELAAILSAGARASALTRQLLAFSRKQVLQPATLNLNTVVASAEAMLRRIIGTHIQLVVSPGADLASIRADAAQLEQVILNLAVNSRDAMPRGGTLTIETRNVMLEERRAGTHVMVQAGPHVLLSMRDTGVGMDDATRRRVFEPFFTTKGVGQGTGLGLSTAFGIVVQSGGDIQVQSQVGGGTTFEIYLPVVPSGSEPADAGVRTPAAAGGRETILVVDDDPGVRQLAKHALAASGYTVLAAASGAAAIQLLARQTAPVHLILMDVVMPGMSGPAAAERLQASHPGIKTLFASGFTDDEKLLQGVMTARVPFIAKPYTVAELRRKVRQVLDS